VKIRLTFVLPFLSAFGVFVWQFLVGLLVGTEAGFMLYGIVGLVPLVVLGFPWFSMLMPSGDLDLTYRAIGTSLAIRYHAAALISLMLNALIVSWLLDRVRRELEYRRHLARGRTD
jgi:hypothetical protein